MAYQVSMTADAVRDLDRIIDYIAWHDLAQRALQVLDAIGRAVQGLGEPPNRGSQPKELADLGIRDFREAYFKPYRIIYRVFEREQHVYVHLIADGRRNLRTLIGQRLLDA